MMLTIAGLSPSAEDLSLFHAQSSPNSSVTTFDESCYTPMSSTFSTITPVSWSSSSTSLVSSASSSPSAVPYTLNPLPDATAMGATWTNVNMPCYFSGAPNQYFPPDMNTWDAAIDTPSSEEMMLFNGLPWLDFNTDTPSYFDTPYQEITDVQKAPFYPPPTHQNQYIQPQPQPQLQPQFTYATTPSATTTTSQRPSTSTTTAPTTGANARNAFLIECKRRGLSYKDIKRLGGFKEAESTLRGRFRTLTKTKDQRVRKPQWEERDVRFFSSVF